jgi:hypothetical protein
MSNPLGHGLSPRGGYVAEGTGPEKKPLSISFESLCGSSQSQVPPAPEGLISGDAFQNGSPYARRKEQSPSCAEE